jgi:hypothetical protein
LSVFAEAIAEQHPVLSTTQISGPRGVLPERSLPVRSWTPFFPRIDGAISADAE